MNENDEIENFEFENNENINDENPKDYIRIFKEIYKEIINNFNNVYEINIDKIKNEEINNLNNNRKRKQSI